MKTPRRENCRFFPSAAAAEGAGYRPCLRCRPELAPGSASVDSSARLAHDAARLIEDGLLNESDIGALAQTLGVTDQQLQQLFESQFGASPVQYGQTHRMLLAKRMLTDTALPVTQVAMASGFGNTRRFTALFRSRYRMNPSNVRKRVNGRADAEVFQFQLAFRPPLDWHGLTAFLHKRAIAGVEHVDKTVYWRTVRIARTAGAATGWVAVMPAKDRPALQVAVSASLVRDIPAVLSKVKRLFDLNCNPSEICAALGPLAAPRPGLRLPGAFDGFEIAVRAVVGQQITVKAARTIVGRFAARLGEPIVTPNDELARVFPDAATVAQVPFGEIAAIGMPALRAKTIVSLARALVDGALHLEPGDNVQQTIDTLCTLPGVGEWTAQYIAMRALSWPNAFPHTDYGVLKALGERNPRVALKRAAQWQPWRAYAVIHLWQSLETAGA